MAIDRAGQATQSGVSLPCKQDWPVVSRFGGLEPHAIEHMLHQGKLIRLALGIASEGLAVVPGCQHRQVVEHLVGQRWFDCETRDDGWALLSTAGV